MIHNIKIKLNTSSNTQPTFTKNQIVNLIHKGNQHNITIKFTEMSRIDGLPTFEINTDKTRHFSNHHYALVSYQLVVNNTHYTIEDIQLISNQIANENKDKIVDFILEQLNITTDTLNEESSYKSIIRQLKLNNIL